MKTLIVVADDSPTVCKIIEVTLKREGYDVICFGDGIEVLRWLSSPQARTPALLFLDIIMPRLDGYETARYLKARPDFTQTIIVMLSRRSGVIDRLKARLAGANDYMTKPFTTQQLLAAVEHYLIPSHEPLTIY